MQQRWGFYLISNPHVIIALSWRRLDMAEDCPSYQLLSGGKRTIQDLALGGLIVANTYQFEVRKRTAT